jgi:hypothetical protein
MGVKTAGPRASDWKLLREKSKDYVAPTVCCCWTGRGPCGNAGVDCVQDKSDIAKGVPVRSYCRDCRVRVFGLTSAEKAARTRDHNKRQISMFAPESK